MSKTEWFASWFDSKWYHLLYQNRSVEAAEREIDSLLLALQLQPGARVLDLACGKGRHSVHLSRQGFDVIGLDISAESIAFAQSLSTESLSFHQHDMRLPYRSNYFDAVFNLFTSFGYFETHRENALVIRNIAQNLKPGGVLLLDFMNHQWVRNQIKPHEVKEVEGVRFDIKKGIIGNHIIKTIKFEVSGKEMVHQEKVELITPDQFEALCTQAGLLMEQQFGNYDRSPYQADHSPRFIFTARKP